MSADFKKMCEENKENRVARVFVSSTFLDMREERDYLGKVVFPRIETFCKKRGVEFVPIDLRWGITEDQAQNGKTLEICLKEIDHSRPFFICLLGDRYDSPISSLKIERDKTLLTDYPNVEVYKKEKIGVTEAEIRHGVLDLKEEDKKVVGAHFWFRAPSSSRSCDPSLTVLKEKIRSDPHHYPVDEYVKPNEGPGNAIDNPEWLQNLGIDIEKILKAWINKTWPEDRDLSWLERQNLDQNAFERSRSRLYVPNPGDYNELNAFADGGDSRVLAVTGESGLGKSSLLINWANHYREKNPKALILTHYVSASEGSDQPENILRRLTEKLKASANADGKDVSVPEQLGQSKSLDDWKKEFWNAVNERLSKGPETSLVLVIDGLNQLSEYGDAKNLVWLPEFAKAKVIVSTVDTDGKTVDAIQRRNWKTHKAQPLTEEQKYDIIKKILHDRGRSLSPERTQKIVESPITSNPLALCVLLDELCCFTDFKLRSDSKETHLDLALGLYVASASIDDLLEKIFERVEESLSWLDKTPDKGDVVPLLASLIAVSRYGLTDSELMKISGCSQLAVSTFLNVFDAHLVDRSGRYSYSHNYIRKVIEKRYKSNLSQRRQQLADFFDKMEHLEDVYLDDAEVDTEARMYAFKRRCQEVPWQLKELCQWERLYKFLLDFDVLDELCYGSASATFESNMVYYGSNMVYYGNAASDFCMYWNDLLGLEKGIFTFNEYFKLDDSCFEVSKRARVWSKLGVASLYLGILDISEESYNKALVFYRDLVKHGGDSDYIKKNEVHILGLANTLIVLAIIHINQRSGISGFLAVKELLESLDLCMDSEIFRYRYVIGQIFNLMAHLYSTLGYQKLAESTYEKNLESLEKYEKGNPGGYKDLIAQAWNDLGTIHAERWNRKSKDNPDSEYEKSLKNLYDLSDEYPEVYDFLIAKVLFNRGVLYCKRRSYSLAEKSFRESLGYYYKLAERTPVVYGPYVVHLRSQLAYICSVMHRYGKAKAELSKINTLCLSLPKGRRLSNDGLLVLTKTNLFVAAWRIRVLFIIRKLLRTFK